MVKKSYFIKRNSREMDNLYLFHEISSVSDVKGNYRDVAP